LPMLRPPVPPLFPYTTLFRSWASSLGMRHHFQHYAPLGMTNKVFNLTSGRADMFDTAHASSSGGEAAQVMTRRQSGGVTQMAKRSEEHTSELQSRENLVCRLL